MGLQRDMTEGLNWTDWKAFYSGIIQYIVSLLLHQVCVKVSGQILQNKQACMFAIFIWIFPVSNGLGKKQLDFNQLILLIILSQWNDISEVTLYLLIGDGGFLG